MFKDTRQTQNKEFVFVAFLIIYKQQGSFHSDMCLAYLQLNTLHMYD
jgi:hypothetical protein